jgi:PadR family transcriptional regulator
LQSKDTIRMSRESLGEFEQLVLLSALRLGESAYAVTIIEEIEAHSGRKPTHGAVYVALRRLEHKRLIETYIGDVSPDRGGRPPRLVQVKPEAVRRLKESRAALVSLWSGLDVMGGDVG